MDKHTTQLANTTCNARTANAVVAGAGFAGPCRPVLGHEVPLT